MTTLYDEIADELKLASFMQVKQKKKNQYPKDLSAHICPDPIASHRMTCANALKLAEGNLNGCTSCINRCMTSKGLSKNAIAQLEKWDEEREPKPFGTINLSQGIGLQQYNLETEVIYEDGTKKVKPYINHILDQHGCRKSKDHTKETVVGCLFCDNDDTHLIVPNKLMKGDDNTQPYKCTHHHCTSMIAFIILYINMITGGRVNAPISKESHNGELALSLQNPITKAEEEGYKLTIKHIIEHIDTEKIMTTDAIITQAARSFNNMHIVLLHLTSQHPKILPKVWMTIIDVVKKFPENVLADLTDMTTTTSTISPQTIGISIIDKEVVYGTQTLVPVTLQTLLAQPSITQPLLAPTPVVAKAKTNPWKSLTMDKKKKKFIEKSTTEKSATEKLTDKQSTDKLTDKSSTEKVLTDSLDGIVFPHNNLNAITPSEEVRLKQIIDDLRKQVTEKDEEIIQANESLNQANLIILSNNNLFGMREKTNSTIQSALSNTIDNLQKNLAERAAVYENTLDELDQANATIIKLKAQIHDMNHA